MAIYLDEQTRTWVERLVKNAPDNFIKDRVVKMLVADRERLEAIVECEHEYGKYHGIKHCCKKCLTTPAGYGEDWILTESFEPQPFQPTATVSKGPDLGI